MEKKILHALIGARLLASMARADTSVQSVKAEPEQTIHTGGRSIAIGEIPATGPIVTGKQRRRERRAKERKSKKRN